MESFHSEGKKCIIISSARSNPHVILVTESSTSHPEVWSRSKTSPEARQRHLAVQEEGAEIFPERDHDVRQIS